MLLTTGKVDEFINNPYLETTRSWFADRRHRRIKIREITTVPQKVNKIQVKDIAETSLADAHLLTSGLQMLDYMVYESRDPKTMKRIEAIFLASNAAKGWEVRVLPSGRKHIVRITDEIVLTHIPLNINEDEVEYINQLPWMMQYMLDR